jgi:hypothetical protein
LQYVAVTVPVLVAPRIPYAPAAFVLAAAFENKKDEKPAATPRLLPKLIRAKGVAFKLSSEQYASDMNAPVPDVDKTEHGFLAIQSTRSI